MQVTDFRETVMEVRILASAGTAGRAFDLRCEIREGLAAFLRDNHPEALPLRRVAARECREDGGAAPAG